MSSLVPQEVPTRGPQKTGGFRDRLVGDTQFHSAVTKWKILRYVACMMAIITQYPPIINLNLNYSLSY